MKSCHEESITASAAEFGAINKVNKLQHTKVICPKCGSVVIPRLWHYGGSLVFYTSTQHICPICAVVMYESPGGVRALARYGAPVLFLFFSYLFISHAVFSGFIICFVIACFLFMIGFPKRSAGVVKKIISIIK